MIIRDGTSRSRLLPNKRLTHRTRRKRLIDDGQHLTNLVLKSISVSGFRGSKKNIEFEVSRDANFLIGRNGTGKTTLINIISDCLSCRYQSLMLAPFESATITFRSADKRHRPFLVVRKIFDDQGEIEEINYSFTNFKTKGPSFEYSIKSRLYRRGDDYAGSAAQRRIMDEFSRRFRERLINGSASADALA